MNTYYSSEDYTINERVKELFEISWNRVVHWMKEYDIATITAFRDTFANMSEKCEHAKINSDIERGHSFTRGENLLRNRKLRRILVGYGYGVTTIYGKYIEGVTGQNSIEVGEQSFFVVNLNNDKNFYDKLFELAEIFNQDSFLYKPKDCDAAYLVGTNFADYPGYKHKELAGTLTSLPSRFMCRIKNAAFAFVNKDNWIIKDKKSDISSDEMSDILNDYSWRDDERPTFKARKEERIEKKKIAEDWYQLNTSYGVTLESLKDLSPIAKKSLVGVTDDIKPI